MEYKDIVIESGHGGDGDEIDYTVISIPINWNMQQKFEEFCIARPKSNGKGWASRTELVKYLLEIGAKESNIEVLNVDDIYT